MSAVGAGWDGIPEWTAAVAVVAPAWVRYVVTETVPSTLCEIGKPDQEVARRTPPGFS